jgi:hypothetical protein
MRHGWAFIYVHPPCAKRVEELVDHFAIDGISLAEPDTGRVIRLSGDGEQISSSREDILRECVSSPELSFNLYVGPSDNVFCSIKTLSDEVLRESYSLQAKSDAQSQLLTNSLARLFCERVERRVAFGFVVDSYAELHRESHWDDFFLGDVNSPPEWPLLIGCSSNFNKLDLIPDRLYIREVADNCILFRRGIGIQDT